MPKIIHEKDGKTLTTHFSEGQEAEAKKLAKGEEEIKPKPKRRRKKS